MAILTVQTVSRAGIAPTNNAVSSSDRFINNGRTLVHVINGGGTTLTVTIVTPAQVDGLAVADRTVSIAAGQSRFIGPFPKNVYNDGDGYTTLEFSATTSVTCAVINTR